MKGLQCTTADHDDYWFRTAILTDITLPPCSHGRNALTPPKKPGFLMKLWAQTNNIMIWILLCSAVVVVALQQWIEFGECVEKVAGTG